MSFVLFNTLFSNLHHFSRNRSSSHGNKLSSHRCCHDASCFAASNHHSSTSELYLCPIYNNNFEITGRDTSTTIESDHHVRLYLENVLTNKIASPPVITTTSYLRSSSEPVGMRMGPRFSTRIVV